MFLLLIFIHEFGHFTAAKITGVRVNEFSIGFGPRLFSKKLGETEYMIKAVPFGGYCAMEGETEESEDKKAFCNKSPLKRLFIVISGALFNLLSGLLIVLIIILSSSAISSVKISSFTDGAVSVKSGLKEDDVFYSVNGRRIYSTVDLSYVFSGVEDDGKLNITVIRDGKKVNLKDVTFETEREDDINYVKIDFYVYGIRKSFKSVVIYTFKTALSYGRIVFFSLIDLITGRFGISAVSGPVGLTAVIGETVRMGILNLLPIMALITINLGIFNLLPVPALDGGRVFFILIEIIIGKPVPPKYENAVHSVGLILLLVFMAAVTVKDIASLIVR